MTTFVNFGQARKFHAVLGGFRRLTTPETGAVNFFETLRHTYNESKVRPCPQ